MRRRPLPRHLARVLGVALVAALASGCSDADDTRGGGLTAPAATPAATATASDPDPDPTVTVTPSPDRRQPADSRRAGESAADDGEEAIGLRIPAVGLSTELSPQGLRGGKIDPRPHEVIWYTGHDRVAPGEQGTAVIAGHVISGGEADEFAALEQLAKGDGVTVSYPSGAELRLEVVSTEIVDKTELQRRPEIGGAHPAKRRVVLVTCDDRLGFREDGHRTANFVAVAELR